MKICLLGYSKRHDAFQKYINDKGLDFQLYKTYDDIPDTIDSDVIVFPIPTTKNGRLNIDGAPFGALPEDIINRSHKILLAITCNYNSENNRFFDISQWDDFAYLNAVPTAEGAIKLAIENFDKSISEQRIVITGFGRVGKILSDRLRGLGCDITVSARSLKDLYYARALNIKTLPLSELHKETDKFDIIFQTIPTPILSEKFLKNFPACGKIIELSSGMRGTDLKFAKDQNITVIDGTCLPEKTAPLTAGNIWAETVLKIVDEQGDKYE